MVQSARSDRAAAVEGEDAADERGFGLGFAGARTVVEALEDEGVLAIEQRFAARAGAGAGIENNDEGEVQRGIRADAVAGGEGDRIIASRAGSGSSRESVVDGAEGDTGGQSAGFRDGRRREAGGADVERPCLADGEGGGVVAS